MTASKAKPPRIETPWRLNHTEVMILDKMLELGSLTKVGESLYRTKKTVGTHLMRIKAKMMEDELPTMLLLVKWDRYLRERGDK